MRVKATNCAALPISLAFFDNSWRSKEIRSTTASIAELNNSTMSANKHTATIRACSTRLTLRKKLMGINMALSRVICRNAASFKNAALKPAIEYPVALKIRLAPVLPLNGEILVISAPII